MFLNLILKSLSIDTSGHFSLTIGMCAIDMHERRFSQVKKSIQM